MSLFTTTAASSLRMCWRLPHKKLLLLPNTQSTTTCRRHLASAAADASSSSPPLVKTALNEWHKELGGDMVPFAGYELPVLYKGSENGGVMKEHLWCRADNKASLFDVSHMGQVSVQCSVVV